MDSDKLEFEPCYLVIISFWAELHHSETDIYKTYVQLIGLFYVDTQGPLHEEVLKSALFMYFYNNSLFEFPKPPFFS